MWNRFTERARRIVETAKVAATDRGVADVGDEHLLFALIEVDPSMALAALDQAEIDLEGLRQAATQLLPYEAIPVDRPPWLASRGKLPIDFAWAESQAMGQNWIGSEHLLLGLVSDTEGNAGRLLRSFGLTAPALRKIVLGLPRQSESRD
jgi:ATP-dependent Clp protease ATP-binding subunit ClpC